MQNRRSLLGSSRTSGRNNIAKTGPKLVLNLGKIVHDLAAKRGSVYGLIAKNPPQNVPVYDLSAIDSALGLSEHLTPCSFS
jgi:hypothetical protein